MKIISLGWGIQSFSLAAMVALGELEPIDFAIHADTTHESRLTYEFADRWQGWLEERGVKVVTVKNVKSELGNRNIVDIPAFTQTETSQGQIRRQCTQDWKIAHMRRYIQLVRNGQLVEQWLGISLDEFQRMRQSDVRYITNVYPLIEKRVTRQDCVKWLESHGLEVPPKSACTFCPYHSMSEWRRIKNTPEDWKKAIDVDNAIRKARPPYELFVHPARKPLAETDMRTMEEKGQMSLWENLEENECTGTCFV